MKRFLYSFFILLLALTGCSKNSGPKGVFRIAIDPNFYPVNFQDKNDYVSGFIDDLLLEISTISGMRIEKITSNWDTLFSNLKKGNYQAILSVLPPYNFNLSQYEFSDTILSIGPVLVTAPNTKFKQLSEMHLRIIGILSGSKDIMLVQKYPDVLIRMFDTNPEMLAELEKGSIDGVIVDVIPAVGYLNDNFYKKLKIAGSPLNDQAVRLVTLKNQNTSMQRKFDKALRKLKKNKAYQKLLQKWNLSLK